MTSFWSAMVNAAILSALLSLVVLLALRITPRRALNAASRYAIWWIVLVVSLALPLGHVGMKVTLRMAKVPAVPPRFTEVSRQFEWETPVVESRPAVARGIALPVEIPASPWLRGLAFFWIAGSALLLMRVFVSYAALYRRSGRATVRHERVVGGRRVRIASSNEIGIPIATGPFRPAILIPSRLFEQVSAADIEQIISHEAAHLARRDDYALFIQRVIEALFALNPVIRWVTRQIDLEREVACDDIVVGSTENARTYAECLTRMVALCGGVRPSLAATSVADSRSHLSRRIELLVDRRRSMQTHVLAGRIAIIAIALVCAGEVLAKTPLLVAFAIPHTAIPQTAIPRVVEGSDPPAPKAQTFRPTLIAQTAHTQPEAPVSPSGLPLYVLGPRDVLAVTVFDNKVIPGTYAIGTDGDLSVPLIGDFKASGLTIPQVHDLIAEKIRDDGFISDPIVNVQLLRSDVVKPRPASPTPILIAQSPIVAQSQIEAGKKANSQVEAKDFDGAIATYQTLLTEVSSSADKGDLWARISDAYRLKGDFPASIQAMEKAIALLPENAPMINNLAFLYDAQGDFVHARQYYEKSLAINPNNPLILNNMAYMLAETGGDLNLALTYARTAKQKFPESLAIDDTIGSIYLKKAMPEAAIAEFKLAIAGTPNNPEYRYHYALALYQQGNLADALSECKVALLDHPKIALERNLHDLIDKLTPEMDPPEKSLQPKRVPPK